MKKDPRTDDRRVLLTLGQLAKRWGLSPMATRTVVQGQRVPFLHLAASPFSVQIRWSRVRFRLDALEAWEHENHREFKGSESEESATQGAREWWE